MGLQAQQTAHKHVIEMNYLLYLPQGYEADTIGKWPLVVFLHGAGETGNDVEKLKIHGPSRLINKGRQFPFILLSPQSPSYGWQSEQVMSLIMDIESRYRVDIDRIYLTGLSMGGFGTWDLAQKYPDLFAAIVPICGGGDPNIPWTLKNMPVWCFHGAKDNVVDPTFSQKTVDALKPYNADVKLTIYPEAQHDSWTETYNNNKVYEWMLSHKRFKHKQISLPQNVLESYKGIYCNDKNDSIRITAETDYLQIWNNKKLVQNFKPSSENVFFINPDTYEHIEFEKDADNKPIGFRFLSRKEKITYRKL